MKKRYSAAFAVLATATLASAAQAADAPANLPTVVTAGKSRLVLNLVDRKVYKVSDDLQAMTGSAADVLSKLPSVDVDADGKLSLRGDSKVMILIDGKPSALLSGPNAGDGLMQLSAGDIDRVEVMNNPPPEYRAEGTGGVINIITRRNLLGGPSASAQASLGNHRRGALSAIGSWQQNALSLNGSVGLRQDDRQRNIRSQLTVQDPKTQQIVISDEQLNEHLRRVIPSVKAGLDYKLSDQQSLSLDSAWRERTGDRFFDQHNSSNSAPNIAIKLSDRHSDGHEWSRNSEQTLRFKQQLRVANETLTLGMHRSVEHERERYAYQNVQVLPQAALSVDHLYLNHDLVMHELTVDYLLPLSDDSQLKAGAAAQHDNNHFFPAGDDVDPLSGAIVPNPALNNDYRFHQNILAAYASWQRNWDNWTFLAGARVEHTAVNGEQHSSGETLAQRYGGVYPSLRLEHSLSEQESLTLGYGRRLSRPDPESLNPLIDHQDTHNLRSGNPNLRPQDTQSVELGYRKESNKATYGVTGYWRINRNSVTDLTQLISPDVTLITKVNLPRTTSEGLEFNLDGALGAQLSGRLSGNLFQQQIDATALGTSGLRSSNGLNLKASLDWHPSAIDVLQLSFSRTDRRLTPQGSIAPIQLLNLGFKRQLRTDLSLVCTVADLFNGQRLIRESSLPGLNQRYERVQPGQSVFIGLSYTLGKPKKSGKSSSFDYEQ
ncbi:TonB-dependent receptor [Paucibacter sp. DJ1R-11]|uniref:TonB-dependent receptor domain-containing protein n=1 Tax=Paucibacter sp. DJ1R-11 TaxID=2893556 RepID=UPI0021E4E68A|nr:TonB-dependent receptor [Paucibacter sp. DJ1R-11]MCV2365901.1 TonB-dependent receptor [Paucibacter sp. DJ1R-11]